MSVPINLNPLRYSVGRYAHSSQYGTLTTVKYINVFGRPIQSHSSLGAYIWIASIQTYLVQLFVALRFTGHYSLMRNTISDLGNSACGQYMNRFVCSPAHVVMNVSFVILGITTAIGALCIYFSQQRHNTSTYGLACIVIAGVGTILVGLFPENSTTGLHLFGAQLLSILGNLGFCILGPFVSDFSRAWRYGTVIFGVFGLVAVYLFVKHYYLGLGIGGMERLGAYPLTIWMIAYGVKSNMG